MVKKGQKVELVVLLQSAWFLKVRWALKHHGVKYRITPYTPLIGEYWLRWKTGKWSGRVSTPVLITPDGALLDSFDICEWAEDHTENPSASKLFPQDKLGEIRKWNDISEQALHYARTQTFARLKKDKGPVYAMMPPFVKALGPIGDWFSTWFIDTFTAKYKDLSSAASIEKTKAGFLELRKALKDNKGYILGHFSYADVTMAVALQAVEPVGPPISKMSEEKRKEFRNTVLAAEFGDLLEWRDKLYKDYFPQV
ncbi:g4406 [Coccomyxa viridis]|uniref:G4406 protein n=1 Tax=Coccomyxa viridis TaxID=1274662 RepID=A0ABP1FVG9_9CHLO